MCSRKREREREKEENKRDKQRYTDNERVSEMEDCLLLNHSTDKSHCFQEYKTTSPFQIIVLPTKLTEQLGSCINHML